ncbi:MAG: 3-dehydroquinate dehydratase [Solirubrobacteraceae bacterium]|jgi:3-dehydroquinate dehydratase-2|nr:3-dehydroquinate dehydratase [Solirubrobacteraceae bacterium]
MRGRISIMHGVNLDQLDRRPPGIYGELTLPKLEEQIGEWAAELGLDARFFQSNFEGAYVEELHRAGDYADALILNPGAWTHYAWAIRDAVEIAGMPTAEVHLSDVMAREEFRQVSVIRDVCVHSVWGKGPEGYREALVALRDALA